MNTDLQDVVYARVLQAVLFGGRREDASKIMEVNGLAEKAAEAMFQLGAARAHCSFTPGSLIRMFKRRHLKKAVLAR